MNKNNNHRLVAGQRKTVFSGVQPSGVLHIGNYLGAISNWVDLQDTYNSIFCVVDYHAITVKQDPKELNRNILDVVKIYMASGINPEKSVIFLQSDISAHTELTWILNCVSARLSDLNKMIQFKDKAGGEKENVSIGLYDYPILMASDILLYNTDAVPVGEDQKQHVELSRTLARRFNSQYGNVFKVPEVIIKKEGARIMGLDDPTKKMSKSASAANYIALTDTPEVATKKIMRAVTDSGSEIKYDKNKKPAISNLLTTYSLFTGDDIKVIESKYEDKGPASAPSDAKALAGKYGDFKKDLARIVGKFLNNFQKKFNSFEDDEIREILKDGAERVRPVAEEMLMKVKEKIGINVS